MDAKNHWFNQWIFTSRPFKGLEPRPDVWETLAINLSYDTLIHLLNHRTRCLSHTQSLILNKMRNDNLHHLL